MMILLWEIVPKRYPPSGDLDYFDPFCGCIYSLGTMRLTWTVPILVVVIALAGGRGVHLLHGPEHDAVEHSHSHGHSHGDEYHEHHHGHDEAVNESLDDHAGQPHEHGVTNAPEEESSPTSLVATAARRDQWKPTRTTVAVVPFHVFVPNALDKSPATPPPRSRAGPMPGQLAALRSIILQV
jgi:hypothetical protein